MCETEPGLFKKGTCILSIYVDDSLLSGPNKNEVDTEVQNILNKFPGKIIAPKIHPTGAVEYDILGSTLTYNREKRFMKLTMADAVDRVIKKFHMEV